MSGVFETLHGGQQSRYGDHRHPDLPWGYWLVSGANVPGQAPLIDEDGTEWDSVRDAFWSGRLGLPETRFDDLILDFMASYMAITDGRFVAREERVFDIFEGDRHVAALYHVFLEAAGLVERNSGRLTSEGRAILLMLIATRTQNDARDEVGMDWIVANRTVAGWQERKAAAELVDRREQVAARLLHRFATDEIDGKPAVKLIGLRITKEIPVRSTLWTMTWDGGDRFARDRFYLWLLERIDRWDDWSEMVTDKGARALSEHFMKLAFCDRFSGLMGTGAEGGSS